MGEARYTNDDVRIRLMKDQYVHHFDSTLATGEQDPEMLYHRINNAFIERLALSFRQRALCHLKYLRANAEDIQCKIGTLRIDGCAAAVDYALIDFLGGHLKPKIYETWMYDLLRRDYATLFAHNALRGKVTHLVYEVSNNPPSI